MHRNISLILIFLTGTFLILAGCTQPSQPDNNINVIPTSAATNAYSLYNLALTKSDLPASYVIVENRTKTRDELSSLALDLGWVNGYMVRSVDMSAPEGGTTELSQTIAIYPTGTVQKIIVLAEKQDRSGQDMQFIDLPLPPTGENTRAFHGIVNVIPAETPTGLMHTSISGNSGNSTLPLQNFSEEYCSARELCLK